MDSSDTVLALLALGAALLAAEAQQAAKVARIGYLSAGLASSPYLREAFLQGLRDFGYVEGRNVVIAFTADQSRKGPWRPCLQGAIAGASLFPRPRDSHPQC